jgi:hypothetical protein
VYFFLLIKEEHRINLSLMFSSWDILRSEFLFVNWIRNVCVNLNHIFSSASKLKLHSFRQDLNQDQLVGCKWPWYGIGGELSWHTTSRYVLLYWTDKVSFIYINQPVVSISSEPFYWAKGNKYDVLNFTFGLLSIISSVKKRNYSLCMNKLNLKM